MIRAISLYKDRRRETEPYRWSLKPEISSSASRLLLWSGTAFLLLKIPFIASQIPEQSCHKWQFRSAKWKSLSEMRFLHLEEREIRSATLKSLSELGLSSRWRKLISLSEIKVAQRNGDSGTSSLFSALKQGNWLEFHQLFYFTIFTWTKIIYHKNWGTKETLLN